jgi:hypothetical protein
VSVDLTFARIPTSVADLRSVLEQAALAFTPQLFHAKFPQPGTWLAGEAAKGFSWVSDSAKGIGTVLNCYFGLLSDEATGLLKTFSYQVDDVATALTAWSGNLDDRAAGLVATLKRGGYTPREIGLGLGAALPNDGTDFAKATVAVAAMYLRFTALDQIQVPKGFGLQLRDALDILYHQALFDPWTLARAAVQGVYQASQEAVSTALLSINIDAKTVLQVLRDVFGD